MKVYKPNPRQYTANIAQVSLSVPGSLCLTSLFCTYKVLFRRIPILLHGGMIVFCSLFIPFIYIYISRTLA